VSYGCSRSIYLVEGPVPLLAAKLSGHRATISYSLGEVHEIRSVEFEPISVE